MRTTIELDDELLAKGQALANMHEKSSLVKEALKALTERESAKKLANLDGTESELETPPRMADTLPSIDEKLPGKNLLPGIAPPVSKANFESRLH